MDQTKRSAYTRGGTAPPLALPPPLDAALGRLTASMARLKAAGERHATRGAAAGSEDGTTLQEDRTRLALDAALARVARLGEAHGAALERLGRAEASIEAVLADLTEDEEEVTEPPIEEAS